MRASASGSSIQQDAYGEVALAPESGEEFSSTGLPSTWQDGQESAGGTTVVSRGALDIDGRWAGTRKMFSPGRTLAFKATFSGPANQWVGVASGNASAPFAMFGLRGGVLYAAVNTTTLRTLALPATLVGSPHRYRIDWTANSVSFFVDGKLIKTQALSMASARPLARDALRDGTPLVVDWVRFGKYAATGTHLSRVLDAQQMVTWDRAFYRADVPTGTALRVRVRTGSTPTPDATWSAWETLSGSGARVPGASRYLQYRVDMATSVSSTTPVLRGIGFTHNGDPILTPGEG
jgi:large repetitive protein